MERDRLLSENPFKDWMRRDFNAFLRACEKHGRQNIDAVAKEVESKSEEEVKAYAEVFFARYTELHDYEKYIKQIERGEQKIQRQQSIMKARPRFLSCERAAPAWPRPAVLRRISSACRCPRRGPPAP